MKHLWKWAALVVAVGVVWVAVRHRQAATLNNRGVEAIDAGRYEEAVATLERSLARADRAVTRRNLREAREALALETASRDEGGALRQRMAERIERMRREGWRDVRGALSLRGRRANAAHTTRYRLACGSRPSTSPAPTM